MQDSFVSKQPILVTGGAGFIGSNFVLDWIRKESGPVVTLDKLTYAGNLGNLASLESEPRHTFIRGDIRDADLVASLLQRYTPRAVVHFAAESHVDRSITDPGEFVSTNVNGTLNLLQQSRTYWETLSGEEREAFRFLHVSTDEVYGTLGPNDPAFTEQTPYAPNSPYAASKAGSDHLVRAYHHTYGFPTLTTNCSNNYGPFQFPEKLIPLVLLKALDGEPLPVYGDGQNVRDWLYVLDHCEGIRTVLEKGKLGETYNIGGSNERKNIDVVTTICDILDELQPSASIGSRRKLITYVKDRPGHDRRYAIDATKIRREIGWTPKTSFEPGIRATVEWYLANLDWVKDVRSGAYMDWLELNYKER
ncbi:dTDP-glucose 4,6-dehydratase [Acidisarcina polymorpha]|uniref:dTDP-glucose 4,6-dehydratase n=1 Tax=Acidisarcina polymorpha TaxID=2211140 RepID=A0A2Z5G1I8_9BACT|nr:dTDP-glucose 4,6-dehydratase [Acidisarcina polymorpha]AXC12932.1 dTDP-glucose 4,6-dehydratase [Acidisarcina polymorpha]